MPTIDMTELINYKLIRLVATQYGYSQLKNIKRNKSGWYSAETRNTGKEILVNLDDERVMEYNRLRMEYEEVE